MISEVTGVQLSQLRYTRIEAAGVARQAAAMAAGHRPPAGRRLIAFDLTSGQAARLQEALGGDLLARWVVDIDHATVRYSEDWSSPAAVSLGSQIFVVRAAGNGPDASTTARDGIVIRLPAAVEGVFGTGRHPATRLAAQLLRDVLVAGDDVIDVGTGSGLLAILALRLGARHVVAIDTSAAAVEVARETARLNDATEQVKLVVGELGADQEPADLVVANILAGVLVDLLPALAGATRPGGTLVTSGVVSGRAAEILARAGAAGLEHLRSVSADGWTASALRRPPNECEGE